MRVAIYARVSTTRQAETDLSIPDQIGQVEAYCKRNGFVVVNAYVEPGASATDDKRPAFQQMMADAAMEPTPFDAIIVHSFSRFFRDAVELELNVRRLRKSGIKLIAITQDFGDDPTSQMIRQIIAVFDEHQSRENGKHTKRAMMENARQGYHNSRPPYGYELVGTGKVGNKGKEKKRLAVVETEAAIVRRIYDLYINGLDGKSLGMAAIGEYLNARGMLRRCVPWCGQRVSLALSNPVYKGEYFYNRRSGKDKKLNPEEELICVEVPAIVDKETWGLAEARRRDRRPSVTPARRTASPHLLSGILKCGCCGSGLVVSTGTSKNGKTYGYYTCQKKLSRGAKVCPSKRIAIPKLDHLILTGLAERLLNPDRIQAILKELEKALADGSGQEEARLRDLQRALKERDEAYTKLMEAIEKGVLPLDELTRKRVQEHRTAREEVLAEIGRIRARQGPGIKASSPKQVKAFSQAVRNCLLSPGSGFGKSYVQSLVSEITVEPESVTIQGKKDVLATMIADMSLAKPGVRSSISTRDAIFLALQ